MPRGSDVLRAMLLMDPLPAAAYAYASRAAATSHASRAVVRSAAIRMDMQRRSRAAAEIGQLIATASAADQRRAQEAANTAFWAEQAAGADEADRAARDAYLAVLQQPNAAATAAAATTGEARPSEAKQLLQRIKDAGVAGAVSYAGWELAFWAASVPVCLVTYYQLTGHWPDFSDQVCFYPSHSSGHSHSRSSASPSA